MDDPPRWATGIIDPVLKAAVSAGLGDLLQDSIAYYDRNNVIFRTSRVITANIYALGILTDIMKNIHILTSSENTFLLSDAGEFLRLITEADQCPFIYEKAGNTFENFMIDEFQDTSMVQWKNFYPLISDSMAQGFDNLVVGDIKQSIYRWRNSDWKILRSMIADSERDDRIKTNPLTVNWRSRSNIIRFNNSLFSVLPSIIDEKIGNDSLTDRFDSLYKEAIQQDPGRKEGGYVKIEFVESSDQKDWEELVLEKIPSIIESLQDKGYSASDIGIIVRDRKQGAMVLKCITDYSNNCTSDKKARYSYSVFSNDSLLLSGSPVINFIISVLTYLNNPSDMIAKASFLNLYQIAAGEDNENRKIPDNYEDFLLSLTQKPLYESVEQIILFFELGKLSWNTAWLTTFQDCLLGYVNNSNPDLKTFLEWWGETGCKKSFILPGNQDAIRVLTIHKSKGLEFSAVILPFISWPLDHPPLRQPLLWVKPEIAPFNELGIVPVKCSKELTGTIFSGHYYDEKYSIYLDNLNLLYVALTRAKDVLYGFAPEESGKGSIAAALRESFDSAEGFLKMSFRNNIFECGELPACSRKEQKQEHSVISEYPVTYASKSLKLKLHGENYFSEGDIEIRKRINYGKIMHEVFEGIETAGDVAGAVRKLVLEGKLPVDESYVTEERIKSLLSDPSIAPWFAADNKVMKEAAILLTSGNIRRPDRVIFKAGKTTIIDFKFGKENEEYREQLNLYRSIIIDMGYSDVEAFIWYVDRNKIVSV
jgi:ATP-dependent exoDNAse (exonuclease V) beta subunit